MLNEILISVILPTDTYATIRPVIDRLRRQTVHDRIEVVLVTPSAEAMRGVEAHFADFAAIRIVESPIANLADARAVGIRAATAPFVFLGETHSYPDPDLAEILIGRLSGSWPACIPAFSNANPNGPWSGAGFLCDYGLWMEERPAGEIQAAPLYNAAYRRPVLLELGDELASAFAHGDQLSIMLRAAGHQVYFEPSAKLAHVNIAQPWHWIKERYLAGLLIANARSRRWPLSRRLFYLLGSPLIPLVLLWRLLPAIRRSKREAPLTSMTMPLVGLGMVLKAIGEFAGYAGAPPEHAEEAMTEYEVHKLAYAGRGRSQ